MNAYKESAYFTVEIIAPRDQKPNGTIISASVTDPQKVFRADFNCTNPLDEALENLLVWANSQIDSSTHNVELVIWNKDEFARLTSGFKWLSLGSTCFISYYAALMCKPMMQARLELTKHNLSLTGFDRPKKMAMMFQELLTLSCAIENMRKTWRAMQATT